MEDVSTNGMDNIQHVFSYTSADAGRLLGDAINTAPYPSQPSVTDVKRKFEFENMRLITVELHLNTLIEHYRNQTIPRVMRGNTRSLKELPTSLLMMLFFSI